MERYPIKEIKRFDNEFRRKMISKRKDFKVCNFSQIQVIQYLMDNIDKDVSQKDLEKILNIRKSTMSGIIDTMEKRNIIKRVSSSTDGRSKVIKFTDENIKKHKEAVKRLKKINNILISGIPEEKLNIFFEVLDTMRENMNKEEKKNDKII